MQAATKKALLMSMVLPRSTLLARLLSMKRYPHPRMSSSTNTTAVAAAATTTQQSNNDGNCQSSSTLTISQRISARVKERDSWETSHTHTIPELFKFLGNYKRSLPKLPTQEELDVTLPVHSLNFEKLQEACGDPSTLQVTWIGHATCLLQIGGYNILTDPIFSKRCAPTQFAGPIRYRPPPCTLSELLEHLDLDAVLVTHNHYDHLDYHSIRDLAKHAKNSLTFLVPLGLGKWFRSNISKVKDKHQIVELDWHETYSFQRATTKEILDITAVPMQHWTSRRGWDRDATLWCGYSLRTRPSDTSSSKAALFPGDTGFFEGLYDIGKRYGPFDLAMIPIGAYEPRDFMKFQHTNPADAVQMMQAIQARRAVPIHWGTFQLTCEPYLEPVEKLEEEVQKAGLSAKSFRRWCIGETVSADCS